MRYNIKIVYIISSLSIILTREPQICISHQSHTFNTISSDTKEVSAYESHVVHWVCKDYWHNLFRPADGIANAHLLQTEANAA